MRDFDFFGCSGWEVCGESEEWAGLSVGRAASLPSAGFAADHTVRGLALDRSLDVEANPVKAGLVERPELWPYSSAHNRFVRGLELGIPLVVVR
jgi:hypothetical protein